VWVPCITVFILTLLSVLGILWALLSPRAARAECTQWDLSGHWQIQQANGFTVGMHPSKFKNYEKQPSESVPKPPRFNLNKSSDPVPKPTPQEKGEILSPPGKPSEESLPRGGTGNFLKQMKP
jgi:hypothetical protein